MKNMKSLFRMSLNGLHCLSETFSNEPLGMKLFQFAMHLRQNQEEKLHLLFPTGLLKTQIDKPWISNCGQSSSWSNSSLSGLARCRPKNNGALQSYYRPTIQTVRQQAVKESASVTGEALAGERREEKDTEMRQTQNSWAGSRYSTQLKS